MSSTTSPHNPSLLDRRPCSGFCGAGRNTLPPYSRNRPRLDSSRGWLRRSPSRLKPPFREGGTDRRCCLASLRGRLAWPAGSDSLKLNPSKPVKGRALRENPYKSGRAAPWTAVSASYRLGEVVVACPFRVSPYHSCKQHQGGSSALPHSKARLGRAKLGQHRQVSSRCRGA